MIGGPHARCYPEDAARYFDYVLGFTDKGTLRDVLRDCSQHRPEGVHLAASQQPRTLPGVRERWQFIDADAQESAPPQDGSHARQPGVPVHLRLLYRCHGALSTHGLRGAPRGSPVPADQVQAAPGSLARSQFWSPLRRLPGHDRGRRPSAAASTSSPKAVCPCFPNRTSSGSNAIHSKASFPALNPGSPWATNRRPARCSGWPRFARCPNTSI